MINYLRCCLISYFAYLIIVSQHSVNQISETIVSQVEKTTVKVIVNKTSGSGIIIQRDNNNIYTIVTNRHVTNRGNKHQIQTSDNHIYHGKLVRTSEYNDLALLSFKSDRLYSLAKINTEPLQVDETLFVAGFPFNSDRLKISSGNLRLQMIKPLQQGYHTNSQKSLET